MWTDEIIPMVRYAINDIDGTLYSDARLQKAATIAASYVNSDIFNLYTIDVTGSGTITPDPSDNKAFINLTVLKTACLLTKAENKISAGQGITVKDGDSLLDLRGISQYKDKVATSFCKDYEDAKYLYMMQGDRTKHQAIIGPFDYQGRYYGHSS